MEVGDMCVVSSSKLFNRFPGDCVYFLLRCERSSNDKSRDVVSIPFDTFGVFLRRQDDMCQFLLSEGKTGWLMEYEVEHLMEVV